MAAYLIGQVIVIDENQFAPYVQRTSTPIAQHGGQVLGVVRAAEIVEGDWPVGALTALGREGLLRARLMPCHETARLRLPYLRKKRPLTNTVQVHSGASFPLWVMRNIQPGPSELEWPGRMQPGLRALGGPRGRFCS
jgi:hypothetical protein